MHLGRIPIALAQKHAEVVESVFRGLRNELGTNLRGLLLAGSVADGTAADESDLDLFAVTAEPWWQRRRLAVGDLDVDLFLDPVARIENELAVARSAVPISAFASGVILFEDNLRTMTRLQSRAKLVFAGIPAAPSPSEVFAMRMRSRELLMLIDREEVPSTRYWSAVFAANTVDYCYMIRRRWTVPTKRILADLARWAPDVHALVHRLLASPTTDLYGAAAQLYEVVFGRRAADRDTAVGAKIPYRMN